MANWWQGRVTQGFNPPIEPGEDIALTVDTPVTALQPGTVVGIGYGPWGGRIDVNVAPGTVEYYQHLDQNAAGLAVGSQVAAGQELGLSGGQLSGGSHPASPLYSTGPHIEVGETVGGRPVDPSTLIAGGPQTGQTAAAMASGSSTGPPNPLAWLAQFFGSGPAALDVAAVQAGASYATNPASAGGGGLVNISVPDPVASLRSWLGSGVDQAKAQAQGAPGFWNNPGIIIPLVIAMIIVLVVIGAGNKTTTQTQPVPVPVPV